MSAQLIPRASPNIRHLPREYDAVAQAIRVIVNDLAPLCHRDTGLDTDAAAELVVACHLDIGQWECETMHKDPQEFPLESIDVQTTNKVRVYVTVLVKYLIDFHKPRAWTEEEAIEVEDVCFSMLEDLEILCKLCVAQQELRPGEETTGYPRFLARVHYWYGIIKTLKGLYQLVTIHKTAARTWHSSGLKEWESSSRLHDNDPDVDPEQRSCSICMVGIRILATGDGHPVYDLKARGEAMKRGAKAVVGALSLCVLSEHLHGRMDVSKNQDVYRKRMIRVLSSHTMLGYLINNSPHPYECLAVRFRALHRKELTLDAEKVISIVIQDKLCHYLNYLLVQRGLLFRIPMADYSYTAFDYPIGLFDQLMRSINWDKGIEKEDILYSVTGLYHEDDCVNIC